MSPEPTLPWLVFQGRTLVCGLGMKLTRWQAYNKVDNERRMGRIMHARVATKAELNPPRWVEEECDD